MLSLTAGSHLTMYENTVYVCISVLWLLVFVCNMICELKICERQISRFFAETKVRFRGFKLNDAWWFNLKMHFLLRLHFKNR